MLTVMLFLFCFFVGFLAIFWHQSRSLQKQLQNLSEEHAQLRVLLRALESRMDGIAALEKVRGAGKEPASAGECPEAKEMSGHDPLLHLSFEKTRDLPMSEDLALDKPLKLN